MIVPVNLPSRKPSPPQAGIIEDALSRPVGRRVFSRRRPSESSYRTGCTGQGHWQWPALMLASDAPLLRLHVRSCLCPSRYTGTYRTTCTGTTGPPGRIHSGCQWQEIRCRSGRCRGPAWSSTFLPVPHCQCLTCQVKLRVPQSESRSQRAPSPGPAGGARRALEVLFSALCHPW